MWSLWLGVFGCLAKAYWDVDQGRGGGALIEMCKAWTSCYNNELTSKLHHDYDGEINTEKGPRIQLLTDMYCPSARIQPQSPGSMHASPSQRRPGKHTHASTQDTGQLGWTMGSAQVGWQPLAQDSRVMFTGQLRSSEIIGDKVKLEMKK